MKLDIASVPRDSLYRGLAVAPRLLNRAAAEDGAGTEDTEVVDSLMVGHFAVFNEWTEIHSWYEGDFLERLMPGCFTKTFAENRDAMKVQFDHGYDTFVGSAPLGPIDVLKEDKVGAYYEVPLLDTDYNRDRILPLLSGKLLNGETRGTSLLGASFRFRVIKDEWNEEPGVSAHNPTGMPERSILETRTMEFGGVVFPAYLGATAGVRSCSLTDHYLERAREARSLQRSGSPAGTTTGHTEPGEPASSHSASPGGTPPSQAATQLAQLARRKS